jgi:hypothetical protein
MLTDLLMVTGPKSPGSRTSISPPAGVWASAAAKVRQGDDRVHELESLPEVAETQVRLFGGSPLVVNAADTLSVALIVTEQPPLPLQAPLQPMKLMPWVGVAVSVTGVPLVKLALHVDGQLIPAGLLTTVPLPVKLTASVKFNCTNVAATDCAEFIVTLQVPVPLQALAQPLNFQPLAGVAVRVTCVPGP